MIKKFQNIQIVIPDSNKFFKMAGSSETVSKTLSKQHFVGKLRQYYFAPKLSRSLLRLP